MAIKVSKVLHFKSLKLLSYSISYLTDSVEAENDTSNPSTGPLDLFKQRRELSKKRKLCLVQTVFQLLPQKLFLNINFKYFPSWG